MNEWSIEWQWTIFAIYNNEINYARFKLSDIGFYRCGFYHRVLNVYLKTSSSGGRLSLLLDWTIFLLAIYPGKKSVMWNGLWICWFLNEGQTCKCLTSNNYFVDAMYATLTSDRYGVRDKIRVKIHINLEFS